MAPLVGSFDALFTFCDGLVRWMHDEVAPVAYEAAERKFPLVCEVLIKVKSFLPQHNTRDPHSFRHPPFLFKPQPSGGRDAAALPEDRRRRPPGVNWLNTMYYYYFTIISYLFHERSSFALSAACARFCAHMVRRVHTVAGGL